MKISIRNSDQVGKDYFLFFYKHKEQAVNSEHLTKEELRLLGKEIKAIFNHMGEEL